MFVFDALKKWEGLYTDDPRINLQIHSPYRLAAMMIDGG